jgi:hypothetical protein
VTRYRVVNLQQALDGSTVLTLWPPVEMSQINASRDTYIGPDRRRSRNLYSDLAPLS